jgi:hypothetical protein
VADDAAIKIAVLEEQILALRREISVQAIEYQRRLMELNHAHQKQVADQQTFVSSERYEGWQGEMNSWRGTVSNTLAILEGKSGGVTTTRGIIMQILPMVIAILSIVAVIWRTK